MKEKLTKLFEKYGAIIASLLLLFPAMEMGPFLLYFLVVVTRVEWLSILLSFGVVGTLIALPVIPMVWKLEKIKDSIKIPLIVMIIGLCGGIAYGLIAL